MTNKALIFVDRYIESEPLKPHSLLVVAGLSIIERQLRQLRQVGVESVYLVSYKFPEVLHDVVGQFRRGPDAIEVIDGNFVEPSFWEGLHEVLVVQEGTIIDDRILTAVVHEDATVAVAAFGIGEVVVGASLALNFQLNGNSRVFAGILKLPNALLIKSVVSASFQTAPLETILKLVASDPTCVDVNVSFLDLYIAARRREVPLVWRIVQNNAEAKRATKILIASTQKGVLDWPARWIHPIFENFLTEVLLKTSVTPNFITLVGGVFGFYITYLFAVGEMGMALAGAILVGIFDGVDGKLARTKMLSTKLGELEHIIDKLVEYSWYFGIGYFFSNALGHDGPMLLAWITVMFAWAEVVQGEFFRRLSGYQLDDAGPFERYFRIIGARRNTIIWGFIPFALTGQWLMGFYCMAIYSGLTFFVAQWRFIVRTREYSSGQSETIAENFRKTEYF